VETTKRTGPVLVLVLASELQCIVDQTENGSATQNSAPGEAADGLDLYSSPWLILAWGRVDSRRKR
jgi:hypothetical protein